MSSLRPNVLAAKERLADGTAELRRRHQAGASGPEISALLTNLRDAVIVDLFQAALADLTSGATGRLSASARDTVRQAARGTGQFEVGRPLEPHLALVAHGGYGRRDIAPFSDVDLMILHAPEVAGRVAPLADRMLRDIFDAGMILGQSVRTPEQACSLALADPVICTSLVESRLLAGSAALFERFQLRFRRQTRRRFRLLLGVVCRERQQERLRYGETVFLLEPNIKRSRGGLRDLNFMRWAGFLRYGAADPTELHEAGVFSAEDLRTIAQANQFLLWLRNELHFHAGQGTDVLSRAEQLRIAELRSYAPLEGMLPVEQFMRDYFRHTQAVSHLAARLEASALVRDRLARVATVVFGHRAEPGIRVGPAGVMATRPRLERLQRDLTAVIRLADLANLYDAPIAPTTWEAIRRAGPHLPRDISPQARAHFLSLLAHPARLGSLLRDLHEATILERFVPDLAHARGLLQFNQYHKYTVDEHCLRAVEAATDFLRDPGPLGRAYRAIRQKHVLHLALLVHDLGKGHLEDHRELGMKIADQLARRLALPPREAEMLRFLVGKHELMNHLAFHRDTSDDQTAVRLAVQVGSPELLEMLYVLTACDLTAVGPDVWDGWKAEIVTELFHRTMQFLAGESPPTTADAQVSDRREAARRALGPQAADDWFAERLEMLPDGYLNSAAPEQIAADLRLLRDLRPGGVATQGRYLAETQTLQLTIGTSEAVTPGIFHRLTGGLSSHGLEIRSAQINTFADGMVLDRFWVRDPDFAGEPPRHRIEQIDRALQRALLEPADEQPTFRRIWRPTSREPIALPASPTRVSFDNGTSDRYTILDIFTQDRPGLLWTITRSIFELGLSVGRAKIATYLDQVVDVFYVTDSEGRKVEDEGRLDSIRQKLAQVIDAPAVS